MRSMGRRYRRCLALGGAVAFALVTLVVPAVAARAAAPSGLAFRVGALDDVQSLSVGRDTSRLAHQIFAIQYPGLTQYAGEDLTPAPGLADAWTPSADGKSYTFHLRSGLKWSDGTPIEPADVVSSLERARAEHWPGTGHALDHLTVRTSGTRGVVVTSSVLDMTLPIIDVPIIPPTKNALTVGSGPYV